MKGSSMFKSSLLERALRIAVVAHHGDIRKVEGIPYILHPVAVALRLQKYGFSDEVVAAALVHDVLEDTDYPPQELRKELGLKVYTIVVAVTNDSRLSWDEKKKKYIETVRRGPEGAKAVALADKIHNLESTLIAYEKVGEKMWDKFNSSKDKKLQFELNVLSMLRETWDHPMILEYERLLAKVKKLK
jgi:(p)ppGpp synthase/HD superfamily hydrolase